MHHAAAAALVFLGGFVIMVLEIVGALYLAGEFGSSFYVWVSQIGVVLTALALGYVVGGALADRGGRLPVLAGLLGTAGVVTFLIPTFARRLVRALIARHPPDHDIPLLWQKLDPALGSALVFLLPCFVLAMLTPYMVRRIARRLAHVGRVSGWIYAASTIGSIAGVFAAGYLLIDQMSLSAIFRAMGLLTGLLGLLCLGLHRWLAGDPPTPAP